MPRLVRDDFARIDHRKNKRQRRASSIAWGNAPGQSAVQRIRALKARFKLGEDLAIVVGMSQSLSNVILHIIFSTKDREPWLGPKVRPRAHAYLSTVCRELGATFVHVGGVSDHVHLVTNLPRTLSQAELIEHTKKTSSKWIKGLDAQYRGFAWQRGYGAFSVSPSRLQTVLKYIDSQQEHHRTRTFQDEYRSLLRKHDVDFDERYVWD